MVARWDDITLKINSAFCKVPAGFGRFLLRCNFGEKPLFEKKTANLNRNDRVYYDFLKIVMQQYK